MTNRTKLHEQATVVIAHDHAMYSLAARRSQGERAVFSNYYAPLARRGGVNVIGLVIAETLHFWGLKVRVPGVDLWLSWTCCGKKQTKAATL